MKILIQFLSHLTPLKNSFRGEKMDDCEFIIWEHFRTIWKGKVNPRNCKDIPKAQASFSMARVDTEDALASQ